MRKPLLILALAGGALFLGGLKAQDTVSPWKVEGLDANKSTIKYDLKSGEIRATNGVRVKYKDGKPEAAELTANNATINQKNGSVVASGNVVLRRDGLIWKSERIEYNFRTKNIKAAQFVSGNLGAFIKGEGMIGNKTNGVYRAQNTIFTTEDSKDPDFYIKAKEVEVAPGQYAIFRGATFYAGKVPIFHLPYYRRNLKQHPWNLHLSPGYKSEWGGFLLSSIRWPGNEAFGGEFNLDYREKRGVGFGPDIQYNSPDWGQGNLKLYRAFDDDPLTDSRGAAIDRERDLAQWIHRYKRGSLTATGVLNYESDEYMRRDFFEDQYQQNVQPNSYFELSKNWSNYNLSVLAQPRVNAFYEGIQRTPDIKLSGTRHQLGNSPFYYDTETSAGYFERRYNFSSANNDYGLFRADTLHQIYMPKTYGGWLNVTPRIGARFTHYGESNGHGSTKNRSKRYIAHTGVEISTKLSKMMPEIDNKLLGISNGARHIIQPSINYAFIPKPNRTPAELDKFDYEITSPRLLPIDLPEYNAIDNIDSQNVLRMSLRNRLQTKRNESIVDVIDWDVYSDWRMDTNTGQNTFADAFSDAYLRPRDWLTLNSNLRYDIDNSLWRTYNHGFSVHPKSHEWSINAGQYYYLAQPSTSTADRTDVYYSGLGFRLNENWSFSTRQYYDSKAGQMSQHDYILHRDMNNWTFFIDLSFRKDTGRRRDDTSISFNYSLKAFPRSPSLD
jgi:LPS-assembly protein